MRWLILIISFFVFQSGFAQIKAIEKFVENHDNIKKLFLYQSNMRILNQDNDPDFNRLIKHVKKINIYLYEEESQVSKKEYAKLTKQLREDGFEDLIQMRSGEFNVNLLLKEGRKDPLYVCSANSLEGFFLLELDGYLDLEYIDALDGLDFESLRGMMDSN